MTLHFIFFTITIQKAVRTKEMVLYDECVKRMYEEVKDRHFFM